MKIKKKIVIPVVVLLAVGLVSVNAVRAVNAQPMAPTVDTITATKSDLVNSVDVTGMVESDNSVNVYTLLNYPVQEIAVEVGDKVKEGDLLLKLDSAALESTIRQNEASLSNAQAKANFGIEKAQKDLETTQYNIEGDYNSQLLQAKQGVEAAEAEVARAENNLLSAQQAAATANRDLRDARDDKMDVEGDQYLSYDDQVEKYQKASIQADIALEGAQKSLEAAQKSLDAAKASQKAAEIQVQQGENTTADAVTSAKLNANFNDQYIGLEKLRSDLEDTTVTAPVSGTVTAIYATEGASAGAGGLLMIIEDTGSLKVKTKVKEFDIGTVSEGMPVTIKADGTGEEEFQGTVSLLSPTSKKDASGNTVVTTSSEFPAEVKVTGKTALRIGMNARLKIITEKRENVISVPLEAVTTNSEGVDVVYILSKQDDGTMNAKMVPITTGLETDFACEVVSGEINEGDEVITNPENLTDGAQVTKLDAQAAEQAILEA